MLITDLLIVEVYMCWVQFYIMLNNPSNSAKMDPRRPGADLAFSVACIGHVFDWVKHTCRSVVLDSTFSVSCIIPMISIRYCLQAQLSMPPSQHELMMSNMSLVSLW